MKNLTNSLKTIIVGSLNFAAILFTLYLSSVFVLILLGYEAMNKKENVQLKEDFEAFIQKIYDWPSTLFKPVEKEEIDFSGKVS